MIHTRALVRENKKKIIEWIDLWMESSSIRIRFQFDWERKARVSRAIRSHVRSFYPCLYPNTGTRTTRVHETSTRGKQQSASWIVHARTVSRITAIIPCPGLLESGRETWKTNNGWATILLMRNEVWWSLKIDAKICGTVNRYLHLAPLFFFSFFSACFAARPFQLREESVGKL